MTWFLFLRSMMPLLVELARDLFRRHGGDVDKAKAELRDIRSQKSGVQADRAAVDAEVEKLRERQ